MKHVLQVDADDVGTRVDRFVGLKLTLSRSKLKALFDANAVKVNGRRVKKGDELAAGQTVEVEHDDSPTDAVADADSFALRVLHEDESVVFVDKPAGVPSQPLEAKETGTLANALIARYPEMAKVGDDNREAGLCHRLDVETSGVVLAARSRPIWEQLRKAFSGDREVEKRYVALVTGPIADEGTIEVPLEHSGDHVRPALEGHGRAAHTDFTVRARHGVYSLVDVKLVTGVLHQVRAHLAAIGAPIVGDVLYGGRAEPSLAASGRFFLHAASLGITHPVTREWLVVRSPLPPELTEVLARRVPQ
jgi:23S rRNA pseudouridine1911/1915/1917 synthase